MRQINPLTRKRVQDLRRKKQPLDGLDFRSADLKGLVFDGRSMRATKLAEATLEGCSFRQADLTGASLWNAKLAGSSSEGACLEGADLDMADLNGCVFKSARVKGACFPSGTNGATVIQSSVKTGRPVRMGR